jgi:phage tail-like protein
MAVDPILGAEEVSERVIESGEDSDPRQGRPPSQYLSYLPAILQEDTLLGQFLLAFERILSGYTPRPSDDPIPDQPALEEYLDRIHTYFNPGHPTSRTHLSELKAVAAITPAEFLPWLSGWVALSLRDDWEEDFKRRFISKIVQLYRQRGTKAGLKQLLELYTDETVEIYEFEYPAHYFQVEMSLRDPENLGRRQQIAKTLLDREKPAHTFYSLQVLLPTMQIRNDYDWPDETSGTGLRVGRNNLLGTTTGSGKPQQQ